MVLTFLTQALSSLFLRASPQKSKKQIGSFLVTLAKNPRTCISEQDLGPYMNYLMILQVILLCQISGEEFPGLPIDEVLLTIIQFHYVQKFSHAFHRDTASLYEYDTQKNYHEVVSRPSLVSSHHTIIDEGSEFDKSVRVAYRIIFLYINGIPKGQGALFHIVFCDKYGHFHFYNGLLHSIVEDQEIHLVNDLLMTSFFPTAVFFI